MATFTEAQIKQQIANHLIENPDDFKEFPGYSKDMSQKAAIQLIFDQIGTELRSMEDEGNIVRKVSDAVGDVATSPETATQDGTFTDLRGRTVDPITGKPITDRTSRDDLITERDQLIEKIETSYPYIEQIDQQRLAQLESQIADLGTQITEATTAISGIELKAGTETGGLAVTDERRAKNAKVAARERFFEMMDVQEGALQMAGTKISAQFRLAMNKAFDNAWKEASEIGLVGNLESVPTFDENKEVTGYRDQFIYDPNVFMRYVADTYIPTTDDPITVEQFSLALYKEEQEQIKTKLKEDEDRAILAANKTYEDLQRQIKQNALNALKQAGVLNNGSSIEDVEAANKWADGIVKEYDTSREAGITINIDDRIKTRTSGFKLDKIKQDALKKGVVPTPSANNLSVTAEAKIAELNEKKNAVGLSASEEQQLQGWESQLALATSGIQSEELLSDAQKTEMNSEIDRLIAEEGYEAEDAQREARNTIFNKYGIDPLKFGLTTFPGAGGSALAAGARSGVGFESGVSGRVVGTGPGARAAAMAGTSASGINYSPPGEIIKTISGARIDSAAAAAAAERWGLTGDPVLETEGFLEFLMQRDRELREGFEQGQAETEAQIGRRQAEIRKLQGVQAGAAALRKAELGVPDAMGVAGESRQMVPDIPREMVEADVRAGILPKEALDRFPATGYGTATRPEFTEADEQRLGTLKGLTSQARVPTFEEFRQGMTRDEFLSEFKARPVTEGRTRTYARRI